MRSKTFTPFCAGLLVCLFNTLQLSAQPGRATVLFNSGWKFHKGDVAHAEAVAFADNGWRTLNLPHDWSVEGPFSQDWASGTAYLPAGIGWYRKTFNLPASSKNKQTFIYFDGVYNNSEVWINGHYLGKRPNGFVSFQYELTPYLNSKGKNIIAVRADHSKFADSRWYTGSGIYRNVYLTTVQPVHIGLWGVGFTTPVVSAGNAEASVNVTVVNSLAKNASVTVKCRLTDAAGKTVAELDKGVNLNKADSAVAELTLSVKNPQLWSVNRPVLYNLKVTLTADGRQTDEWSEKVGIRHMSFDADKGFFLNGENMKLKGVCVHDDAGVLGVAVPEEVWYRRLKTLKESGCNSLRFSHNPHADYLYKLCDELGFLVMDEAFDEWELGKNKWIKGWNAGMPGKDGYHNYFTEWADRDVKDMVLRDRNHPSIIMWSIGNEIDYPNDPYTDPVLSTAQNPQIYGKGAAAGHPSAIALGGLSKRLVAVVKQYDVSRPVTAALAGVVMSNKTAYPENLDLVGYNYQEYRYPADHKTYPKRVIYGSENSMQLSAWNAVDSNAYIAGQYLWTGIDYMGEAHKWPNFASGSGLLDMAGFRKPEFYFRQSLWSAQPMVYIGTAEMPGSQPNNAARNRRDANQEWNHKAGDRVRVNCFTNCGEAELFLNGQSMGKKQLSQFNSTRMIYWDVDYQPGELLVKGYPHDGQTVTYSIKTAGEPAAIAAETYVPDAGQPTAVSQIAIQVVDQNGIPVYSADNTVTVKIDGPATLLGLESGSLSDQENYRANTKKTLNGKLLAYIQSTGKAGTVRVTIESPGLKAASVQIRL